MDSRTIRCLEISTERNAVSENRFGDAAAESPIDVRGFMAALRGEPVVTREQLDEFVAAISSPQPQYGARSAADPSIDVAGFVAAIRGKPVATKEQLDEFVAAITTVHEGTYDPSKHPRAPKGQPDGGQWVAMGGGAGEGSVVATVQSTPSQTAAFYRGQTTAQLAAFSGAQSSTWPTTGPTSSWLPKVGSGAGAAAGAAAGIGAGAFLGALRNGSMGTYWARVPGTQAMPQIWVYELEKRVRAGTLSRDDAVQIFNTAVLGAEAQGFKPTGDRMSAVHKSATDFLGQAEAVYFARKKKKKKEAQGWAVQPGGYQQSGGRVFPTKRNSGLDGYALRQEQEKFFERGLAEGKDPGHLRGQATEAGSKRVKAWNIPDHLLDPEAEAALQRAIRKTQK